MRTFFRTWCALLAGTLAVVGAVAILAFALGWVLRAYGIWPGVAGITFAVLVILAGVMAALSTWGPLK